MFNIRYAVALSKQRGMKRAAEEEEEEGPSDDMSEASLDSADLMLMA